MHIVIRRLAIPVMLLSGTCSTVIQKFMFEQRGEGRDIYGIHKFEKPWYLTLVMFVGEVVALGFYFLSRACSADRDPEREHKPVVVETLLDERPTKPRSNLRIYLLLALPSICDLIGTALMSVGLLYLYASVWQMLRGAMIIFSAILDALALKRPQKHYMWAGVILVTLALLIVGFAAVTANGIGNSDVSSGMIVLSIILTVVHNCCAQFK
jgi:hypothetical protein